MIFLVAMVSVTVALHWHLEILLFIRPDEPSKTRAATTQSCTPLPHDRSQIRTHDCARRARTRAFARGANIVVGNPGARNLR
jgi:hypothetical protein